MFTILKLQAHGIILHWIMDDPRPILTKIIVKLGLLDIERVEIEPI